MLRSPTINSRCGTKPSNLPRHTLDLTLPSQPSVWSPEDVIQAPSLTLQSQPSVWPGSPVIMWSRDVVPGFLTFGSDTTCKSGAAKSSPALYTHEAAPHQALGLPEPTTTGPGPNSTQKTSLMGEDCPPPICCAPPPSIPDVELNPTWVQPCQFFFANFKNNTHLRKDGHK
jgi:hypothetical protein